ncbi:hypothetical protein [Vibrio ouci]|uniref:Uncharacterized protein n=1 Tax=Vibrio ouci TaxID=2499078 RepID=A0A4Y8W7C8_9VIBR|nr:hypothetical protein [Vibrio ouci]TFH88820.1 hypothetical protein ELS82_25895 [Vibrio ouci]
MKKSTMLVLFVVIMLGYFIYDRYVAQPKELVRLSKLMLSQVAIKEGWFDPSEGLRDLPNGTATLHKEIDTSFKDGDTAYANGKIAYKSKTTDICKVVDFKFTYGSLNDYEIFSQSDCIE